MAKKNNSLLSPQQNSFLSSYLDPSSPTYNNAYASAKAAGFADKYAKNIINLQPEWLLTFMGKVQVTENEIMAGLKAETDYGKGKVERTRITKDGKVIKYWVDQNSAIAAQVRLKAWELLGRTKRTPVFANPHDNSTTFNAPVIIQLGNTPQPSRQHVVPGQSNTNNMNNREHLAPTSSS